MTANVVFAIDVSSSLTLLLISCLITDLYVLRLIVCLSGDLLFINHIAEINPVFLLALLYIIGILVYLGEYIYLCSYEVSFESYS